MKKFLISIIIPVFNEEASLSELYQRLCPIIEKLPHDFEIIFVDDGSKDKTFDICVGFRAHDDRFKIIRFSRNFGHQLAVSAGLFYAKGDAVIIMDADLQDPPELLSEMISNWQKGYKVVYAVRREREGESWFKLKTAAIFYWLIKKISQIDIPSNVGDFRLLDKEVVRTLNALPEQHRFLRGLVVWVGFKQIGIYFDRPKRFAGATHYPFKKMFKFAIDGITSFSVMPLRLVMYLGFVAVVFGFGVGAYSLIQHFFYPEQVVRGWTSLMMTIIFFGGVQLIVVGVLGEYIGRIYEEAKRRPLYVIESKVGFDV